MDQAARLMLITGVLLIAGVLSSRLSTRSGVPLLIIFVAVGLFAGEEGPLGISVNDAELVSAISVGLLALILYDGGLGTPVRQIRRVAGPALLLATVGVVVSTVVTGAAAVLILDFSWVEGLLLGSILGSTDSAAVFASFRGRNSTLPERLKATLEVESGLNDPIAVFLVLTLTGMLAGGTSPPWWTIAAEFLQHMVIGVAVGAAAGWGSVWIMRRIHLDIAGLYLVFSLACGLFAFGAAQVFHGSGIIAVYAAGVLIGHARMPFEQGIRRFHDGLAWIAQVGVFVLLGMLAFPSRLVDAAPGGLGIALVLVFVARPLSVWMTTLPFHYDWRDRLVITLGGLRGAVPVILATIPLAANLPGSTTIFNVTFFAVLLSVLVQTTLLVPVARRLGRLERKNSDSTVSLELSALRETGQELLGYEVVGGSLAAERAISELPLPAGALVVMVVRENTVVSPRGSTVLRERDQVYVLSAVSYRRVIGELFSERFPDELVFAGEHEFSLDARLATIGDLEDFYGLSLGRNREQPLSEWLDRRVPRTPAPGTRIPVGIGTGVNLVVLSIQDGRPHKVAVELNNRP
jgi:cell volume regulation protein A